MIYHLIHHILDYQSGGHFRPLSIHNYPLKGRKIPSLSLPRHVSPPPPLPQLRRRYYNRNLRTPRPPIPLPLDTQLQQYPRLNRYQLFKRLHQQSHQVINSTAQREDQPIGLATDLIWLLHFCHYWQPFVSLRSQVWCSGYCITGVKRLQTEI